MKYFLILGTNPSLSIAETIFYFKNRNYVFDLEPVNKDLLIFETEKDLDAKQVIKELGGIIKIGVLVAEAKKLKLDAFLRVIDSASEKIDYKLKFGFSFYGKDFLPLNSIAMNLKKELKQRNISCRWVTSRERALSSVVVEQNKLVDKGVDFLICSHANKFLLGKTLAVQDFKGLSRRDYGRPERDDTSGMLPPKLAQIMINISSATKDSYLLDPFCGSGTVLSEAALLGIKNIIGSDLSQKAIEDAAKNIAWLSKNNNLDFNLVLEKIDSTSISTKIDKNSVDVVVTEPYLGPQRGVHDIKKTVKILEDLYTRSLEEFSKILKKKGTVVMVWPVFVSRDGSKKKYFLDNIKINNFELFPLLPSNLLDREYLHLSRRGGIVYGRPGQKVWREIILLVKK